MFTFFFRVNRSGIITFCGSIIEVEFDPNGVSGKECFRLYEDGFYKNGKPIVLKPTGYIIHLSISHSDTYAVANAVIEKG